MLSSSFTVRCAQSACLLLALACSSAVWADGGSFHQARQTRPVQLGVSGGSSIDRDGGFCCGGTLGALVQDCAGSRYILSNNHVLGRTNRASAGELTVQPALIDTRCRASTNDGVASFTELVPISFDTENLVDAAIAKVPAGQSLVDPLGAVRDIGVPSTQTGAVAVGDSVQKAGRTTGHTRGTVAAVDVSVIVSYPKKCGGGGGPGAVMINQFRITDGSFSDGGDSGSVIFDDTVPPKAVGLLFAGSSTSTIANRIDNVLNADWAVGPLAMAGGVPAGCTPGCTNDAECADQDPCTVDTCGGDGLCAYTTMVCDDGNACTIDSCVAGSCTSTARDCDDGLACNGDETCDPTSGCVVAECPSVCTVDGVCDIAAGESCLTCAQDCAGSTRGKLSDRFCCGDDTDCGDIRCGGPTSCVQGAAVSTPPGKAAAALATAKAVKLRHSHELFGLPEVVGHGVALGADGRPVIEVYLARTNSEALARIPRALENVPVRTVVTGNFEAY